jgi:hypothetical protein
MASFGQVRGNKADFCAFLTCSLRNTSTGRVLISLFTIPRNQRCQIRTNPSLSAINSSCTRFVKDYFTWSGSYNRPVPPRIAPNAGPSQ